jgi:tRNA dimethylallyltransferase
VIVLFGPTAVGKTDALLEVCAPGWQVVSADSMQVYRHMNVGTAKPSADVLARLPHHLLDIVDPDTQFSAGEFVKRADEAVDLIQGAGGIPVVSGGTAFYLRNFVYGLPASPPSDPRIRGAISDEVKVKGLPALYLELQAADPGYTAKIGPTDRSRILRALEVYRATGRPLSSFRIPSRPRAGRRFLLVGLDRPRDELRARIEQRVDRMFEAGLPAEVARLRELGYGEADPGMKAIGYREFLECDGDPERARELIKRDTRQYARRQLVFFRSLPGVHWVPAEDTQALGALLGRFLETGEGGIETEGKRRDDAGGPVSELE